ncbi:uncharacterized protein AKAME5_000173300 [Lates japonicus]|uniref:Uncharacterized protein n=1 Tax=Lates japonicus TaxID=270547 RepID=A0AAD3QVJ1_LATJO|nr:uncharacterized protein AKAME5_000173300 [Lates japonicus]
MKKQVTFAESQTVHRLQQDEAVPRRTGMNELKMVKGYDTLQFNESLYYKDTVSASGETRPLFVRQHAALTPGQKEYLYTIAASYGTAHVRNLITQHYMNVLHRCIRAGARIRLLKEEEEEGLDDSLSDCLSSLSMGDWDDDILSEL